VVNFSTAQPYGLQSALGLAGSAVVLLLMAAGMGLNAGFVHRWLPPQPEARCGSLAGGFGLGATIAGLVSVGLWVLPQTEPVWPSFRSAAARSPIVASAISPVSSWITSTILLLLVVGFVHITSRGWTRARIPLGLVLLALGPVMVGASDVTTVTRWLVTGLGAGVILLLAYLTALRFHLALIPVAAAMVILLGSLHEGILRAYPGALTGGILSAVLLVALGVLWVKRLAADTAAGEETASP